MQKISIEKAEEIYNRLCNYNPVKNKAQFRVLVDKQPNIIGETLFLTEKLVNIRPGFYYSFVLLDFINECYESINVKIPIIEQDKIGPMVKKWNYIMLKDDKKLKKLFKKYEEINNKIIQENIVELLVKYIGVLNPETNVPYYTDDEQGVFFIFFLAVINLMDNEMLKLVN
jgi:hypothetical protein